jgi:hypothetical protein
VRVFYFYFYLFYSSPVPELCDLFVAEKIIHSAFKDAKVWLDPVLCTSCGTFHIENFDLKKCGGINGVLAKIREILSTLGWSENRRVCELLFCYIVNGLLGNV